MVAALILRWQTGLPALIPRFSVRENVECAFEPHVLSKDKVDPVTNPIPHVRKLRHPTEHIMHVGKSEGVFYLVCRMTFLVNMLMLSCL